MTCPIIPNFLQNKETSIYQIALEETIRLKIETWEKISKLQTEMLSSCTDLVDILKQTHKPITIEQISLRCQEFRNLFQDSYSKIPNQFSEAILKQPHCRQLCEETYIKFYETLDHDATIEDLSRKICKGQFWQATALAILALGLTYKSCQSLKHNKTRSLLFGTAAFIAGSAAMILTDPLSITDSIQKPILKIILANS